MSYSKSVNVGYCCSDLFSEVCAVSIVSLFENNKHVNNITVYIYEDNISKKNKNRLLDLASKYEREIVFIQMLSPMEYFHDARYTFDTVGRTYGRLVWGDILPETVHRLISLDSDTIVLGDIEELWNYDLQDKPIGGVDDCMGEIAKVTTQHLHPETVHCNAGVYLIDIDVWRKESWTNRFIQYINSMFDRGIQLGGYEEEVIANVLSGRFKILPAKFNLMTLEQVFTYDEILKYRQPKSYYSEEEILEAIKSPTITHTTNLFYVKKRVFDANSDHPQRSNYLKYREMTPWKDEPDINIDYSRKIRIIKTFWHLMPRKLAIIVARYVRNDLRPRLSKKRDDI